MAAAGIFSLGKVYKQQGTGTWSGDRLYGYAIGDGTASVTAIERIDFSNDTAKAILRGNLSAVHYGGNCVSSSLTAAYCHSSEGSPTGYRNTYFERVLYSNDSANAAVRANHVQQTGFLTMIHNTQYAYSAGGYSWTAGAKRSEITRFSYANDTANSITINNLAAARYGFQKHFNKNYGWLVGGMDPAASYRSDSLRLDFANDTSPLSTRTNRTVGSYTGDGVGTENTALWLGTQTSSGHFSIVDRLDLQNDLGAMVSRGPLSSVRGGHSGVSNSAYGYALFGANPSSNSTTLVDRIDFANDLTTASLRGNLNIGRSRGGATSGLPGGGTSQNLLATATPTTSEYGYNIGGETDSAPPSQRSSINRLDYQNDLATMNERTYLQNIRSGARCVVNDVYSWIGGGNHTPSSPASCKTIFDRLNFANDTTNTTTRGNLVQGRRSHGASENNSYGWFIGGINDDIPSAVSSVDRLDFSSDLSTASARGNLAIIRGRSAGFGNINFAWFTGGYFSGNSYSTVERIEYSADLSATSARSSLPADHLLHGGISDNGNYGLSIGGNSNAVYRTNFASDLSSPETRASLTSSVHGSRGQDGLHSSSVGAGYLTAGQQNPQPGSTPQSYVSSTLRIDFSSSNLSPILRGNMPYSSGSPTNASKRGLIYKKNLLSNTLPQTGTYGWISGGRPGNSSLTDRLDFSNDLSTTRAIGSLSTGRQSLSATGNSNSGWFAGGTTQPGTPIYSIVDRIIFSSDLSTTSVRGNLSTARNNLASTSTYNYGWWAAGTDGLPSFNTRIDRLDFANDLLNATAKSNISSSRTELTAAENLNYGWYAAGQTPTSPSGVSTVDRLDFYSDTANTLVRGPLSISKTYLASTGNVNYGWWGGNSTLVTRIDYASDQSTSSARGNLSVSHTLGCAIGNTNYGWWAGNYTTNSQIDRVDWANDLATSSLRGNISVGRNQMGSTPNSSIG